MVSYFVGLINQKVTEELIGTILAQSIKSSTRRKIPPPPRSFFKVVVHDLIQ
jgi:hypothetical protein